MKAIERGGAYFRVADSDWEDPLDGAYSAAHGGRWNAPGSFPVVYLNATVDMARAQVQHQLSGGPWSPADLDPGPVLVSTDVSLDAYVDVVTDDGCRALGLPAEYPSAVDHPQCQLIGQRAWDGGYPGIACRSAVLSAPKGGEELAWFQRGDIRLLSAEISDFDKWFW